MGTKNDRIWNLIKSKSSKPAEFDYDKLWAPPLLSYLTPQDIDYFHYLANSVKYTSKTQYKYKEIDKIMTNRGFTLLSRGTNRVVYRHYEDPYIVVKIAVCRGALMDNPKEFYNQQFLKPFCCKIFEVSPCGTVALVERVHNYKNRRDISVGEADMMYDMLTQVILGYYVLDDIGTDHFLNYGYRQGFGPVLLDYPYMYALDNNKLYCEELLLNGEICGGEIDYDIGFNKLACKRCGKEYRASQLAKAITNKEIRQAGNDEFSNAHVILKRGDKIIKESDNRNRRKKIEKR